ncbi:MAG: biosynthetic arginine decarboxylase [Gammaproteobacteria bacterium]|nr:MAG: biosynthetic arginine decarboxylase [Gammaproteobacteria bacterium]
MSASIRPVPENYGIRYWSEGFFGIGPNGHATVCPRLRDGEELDLYEIAQAVREIGLNWPVLLRFNDLLRQRVQGLCKAFAEAAEEIGYQGGYRAIYPIKVNQQRSVVEQVVAGGAGRVGLEAGSKPELMAVLAAAAPGSPIVCNGYKDREYIHLALIGQRLGHPVYIVIEKPSELDLVLEESQRLAIRPLLGVRVRLSAAAFGKWQNSGGPRAKFGLSAAQLVALVERLRQAGMLDCLVLLHSHIGSQIPDIGDIAQGVAEAGRFYSELRRAGAPISVVDVGGGLGVDYEGTASRHFCSMNYSVQAYAREVLDALARHCHEHDLPQPMVFSESGRALTAHHAVLVTEVIERESPVVEPDQGAKSDAAPVVRALAALCGEIDDSTPLLVWQQARHLFDQAQQQFEQGELELAQRAHAEQWLYALAVAVRQRLHPASRRHRELLDELNEMLAERVFCNFSLFQSLPDVWAIEQIFPVMPLHRLDEPPSRTAVVHDLTCDSDGCISQYVDQDGVESTLKLHPDNGEPYLLGIFLVGAYQEILGDMHNLFGDTDAVNIELDEDGGWRFLEPERGDSVDELLRYVHFEPQQMLERYRHKLRRQKVDRRLAEGYFRELKAGLHGTTYLTD